MNNNSITNIVLISIMWIVIFGILVIFTGGIFLIPAFYYIYNIDYDSDIKQKIRMIIVGVYNLILSISCISMISKYYDTFRRNINILVAIGSIVAFIMIVRKSMVIFGKKARILKEDKARENAIAEYLRARIYVHNKYLRLENELIIALKDKNKSNNQWAISELEIFAKEGVKEAQIILEQQTSLNHSNNSMKL